MNNIGKLATLISELGAKTIKVEGSFVLTSKYHTVPDTPVLNNLDVDYYVAKNISMYDNVEVASYGERPADQYIEAASAIFNIINSVKSKSVIIKLDDDQKVVEVKINY